MPVARYGERREGAGTSEAPRYGGRHLDPLRRFVETKHAITLQLMGRTLRLESNSLKILDLALQFFASYPQESQADPEFTWRIVCEPGGSIDPTGVPSSRFSDTDLSFVNVGQRSFLAVDAETRRGIAFLADGFAEVLEPKFMVRSPLEFLLYLTVASLGFTSLSAACVSHHGKGILLLGEPNSGKTTASYVAATLGMELLADHVVFLESAASGVRAWGDPFPALFRPKTLPFFPELRSQVRRLSYGGVDFCFFDKSSLQSPQAHSIAPLCSIFLQRAVATEPRLERMSPADFSRHLEASLLFTAAARFESQQSAVFAGLGALPAYSLAYGEDPATAAAIVCELLTKNAGEDNE
jgi:hypothetical protein